MPINTGAQAVQKALADTNNVPETCQLWTRTLYNAPSAGDRDRDGDADAVDGWQSEPANRRHADRKPPRGVPVAWSGGRNGYGHRAISLGPDSHGVYWIRSTDAGGSGKIATVRLDWVEKNWGLRYLGWSETITGLLIDYKQPEPPEGGDGGWVKPTRGSKIDHALEDLKNAKGKGARAELIARATKILKKITPLNKK